MSAFKFVQGDAAGQFAFEFRQQKTAVGRGVVAGQSREFLIEVLEAEAEAERLRVFEEKFTSLCDLVRGCRLRNCKTFNHRGHRGHRGKSFACFRHGLPPCTLCPLWLKAYPISMPPFTLSTWPVM